MGLDDFRREMLNNKHIQKFYDYVNAKDCFPNISISGGVCYFLLNEKFNGECKFVNILNSIYGIKLDAQILQSYHL